jgi:hypothetical protein
VQFRKKAHIFKISEDYLLTWVKKKLDSPGFVAKRRQTFSRRQKKTLNLYLTLTRGL